MPGPVNGVVLIGLRVSGAKTASKAAQDVSAAYAKGGKDAEKASTGFGRFNQGLDAAAKKSAHWLEGAKGIAAGWLGINAAFEGADFIKDSIKTAAESQALQKSLALTMQNTTGATKAQVAEVNEWLEKTGLQYGKTKAELIPAYQSLITSTRNVEKAHELMSTAMDIAAGKHISLAAAANALAKAQNGNVGALSRLGIATKVQISGADAVRKAQIGVIGALAAQQKALAKYGSVSGQYEAASFRLKNAQDALAQAHGKVAYRTLSAKEAIELASKTYKGQAAAAAATYQGSLDRLKVRMEAIKDYVGTHLLPALTSFSGWFLKNIATIGIFAGVIVALYAAYKAYQGVVWLVTAAQTALNVVQGIAVFVSGNAAKSYELEGTALKGYMVAQKAATAGTWLLNVASKALRLTMLALPWVAIAAAVIFVVYAIVKHWNQVKSVFSAVGHWISKVWSQTIGGIRAGITTAKDWVVARLEDVVGFVTGLPSKIGRATVGMWDGMKNAFKSAIDWIIDGWNGLHFKMPSFNTHIPGVGTIGGFNIGLPQIPRLATGGRVYPDGRVVQIAEGGEPETVLKDSQIARLVVQSAHRLVPQAIESGHDSLGSRLARTTITIPVMIGDNEKLTEATMSGMQIIGALA